MNTRITWALLLLILVTACQSQNLRKSDLEKSSDINVELGILYMRDGDYEQAMQKLTKALEQNPRNAGAHNALGLLHTRLQQYDKAEPYFKTSLQLEPENSPYLVNYGAYLCSMGKLHEAEQVFLRAVANPLYKTPEYAYTNAGYCLHDTDMEKAEFYYRKALQVNSRFSQALLHMARVSMAQRHYLRVRAYLQRYSEVAAHTPTTLWLGVQAEKALGDRDAASGYALRLKLNYPDANETAQLLKMEEDERNNRK